ncbi:hypothetical protein ACQJ1P_26715, partial [Klebsiella pneumoniae]|uniref:hypothetical protein n=1 Tax=Klebsiella pneumoniae TaxID=573 RepID=UPI003D050947
STVLTGDLSDAEVPGAFVEAARAAFGGPLAAVVNSASLFDYDTPPRIGRALLRDHYVVNLEAPVLLANALAEQQDLM